ncbi:MAG: lipopolysaccharide heptosyltransferase I [Pseudomonadota bacterium]
MKILLVKLSSLGDVVHALPVVKDILAAIPDAQIDWVLEKSFAPLLSRHAGLHKLIACEIRRWRKSPFSAVTRQEWRAFKADLQREKYDAVIDLQGLTKSALVARLAKMSPGGKRFALANQTEGSGYEAPTRWVADVAITMEPHIHAVQRSRELAARALGYTPLTAPDFGLKTPQTAGTNSHRQVALVHGTSRADKAWPLDHWVQLGRRLQAAGYRPVLAHGNQKEMATSLQIAAGLNDAGVWPVLGLDALTDKLAQCAGVIGVDSGVSHIAVALDLPHVQIYNFDTAWRTGPLPAPVKTPRQLSVFAKPQPTVDSVWQAWLACTEGAS